MARKTADEIAKQLKDSFNQFLFDKAIERGTIIEAFEDAASDLEGILDSLRDDERRAGAAGSR